MRRWIGLLLLLLCMSLWYSMMSSALQVQLTVFVALFVRLTLLVPTFSHLLAGILRQPMGWFFGMEGRLASGSLVQAPRRTSAALSALMFRMAFRFPKILPTCTA
jgi:hypothetical protein